MTALWRALWREPRPAGAAPGGRADWGLVTAFALVALVEGIARPGLAGQPYVTLLAMALMPALLWRRRHPLTVCLIGFGVAGLLTVIQLATRTRDLGLTSMMVILLLLYSLVRWGSGREIALGMPVVASSVALGLYAASAGPSVAIGGTLYVLLFVAAAAVLRGRADLWQRRQREIRNAERLALARELHDTVAHHVSAIAVQAQAGRVAASTQPTHAAQILATIESEASRTLAQMRAMVRVLREDGWDGYSPQPGLANLTTLASADTSPTIEVSLAHDLGRLSAPVETAVYRIVQESLTNARRHARGATHVVVDVGRFGDDIRVRVADDGFAASRPVIRPGFGVHGMTERAELLGGTLLAGPAPDGGWIVEAILPLEVSP